MARRVWVPVEQLRETDAVLTSPVPEDPLALVEVDRADDPAPEPTPEPSPEDTALRAEVDDLRVLALALADAEQKPTGPVKDAADRVRGRPGRTA